MKWRDTAGLSVAVLALLGIGSQPVARWIATRTVSQFASGEAALLGSTHWDPTRHAWTCYDLRIDAEGGESIRAARSTFRLDSKEFLRRNLVIDSAQVDGLMVYVPNAEVATSTELQQSVSLFPSFSVDAWLDTLLNQLKTDVLTASQRREHRRRELQTELERLQKRCTEMETVSNSNPLRSRADIQGVQREISNLLQAIAEEKIRVRETDRELERTVQHLREGWREEVVRSVSQSIPERSRLIRHIAEQSIAQYWESRRALLAYAIATARPLKELDSFGRGKEISIPGIPKNYVMIRSASMSGCMEIQDRTSVRFRASLKGWGDESCAIAPRSEWQFELAGSPSSSIIQAHVERTDGGGGWVVRWRDHTDSKSTCQGILQSTSQGDRLDISIPVDSLLAMDSSGRALVFGGATDWQTSWNGALRGYQGRELAASLPFQVRQSEGIASGWRCQTPEVHADSLAIVSEVWDKTMDGYVAGVAERLQPRIGGLCVAMEQFRAQGWANGTQEHSNALSEIERKTLSLRDTWDTFGSLSERLARMRGTKEGY